MLCLDDLEGKLMVGWWCKMWLPGQNCQVGGDAKTTKSVVLDIPPLQQPLVLPAACEPNYLLECCPESVELLAKDWFGDGRVGRCS